MLGKSPWRAVSYSIGSRLAHSNSQLVPVNWLDRNKEHSTREGVMAWSTGQSLVLSVRGFWLPSVESTITTSLRSATPAKPSHLELFISKASGFSALKIISLSAYHCVWDSSGTYSLTQLVYGASEGQAMFSPLNVMGLYWTWTFSWECMIATPFILTVLSENTTKYW